MANLISYSHYLEKGIYAMVVKNGAVLAQVKVIQPAAESGIRITLATYAHDISI